MSETTGLRRTLNDAYVDRQSLVNHAIADAIDAVAARVQILEESLAVEADPRFRDRVRTLEDRQDAVETRLAKLDKPAPVEFRVGDAAGFTLTTGEKIEHTVTTVRDGRIWLSNHTPETAGVGWLPSELTLVRRGPAWPADPAPASPVPSDLVERLANVYADAVNGSAVSPSSGWVRGMEGVVRWLRANGWGDVAQVARERDELREWKRTRSVDSTLRTRAEKAEAGRAALALACDANAVMVAREKVRAEAAEAALAATTKRANDATRREQELRNELADERKAHAETRAALDVERRTAITTSGRTRIFPTRELRLADEKSIRDEALKAREELPRLRAELDALKARKVRKVRTFRTRKVTKADVHEFLCDPGYSYGSFRRLGFRREVKP
jgi:hypothetical protein